MNISDKALDAAVRALFEDGCGEPKVDAATMLEAAAPLIATQALDDFESHLKAGIRNARNGGEQHLHEDALIMLNEYRGNQ